MSTPPPPPPPPGGSDGDYPAGPPTGPPIRPPAGSSPSGPAGSGDLPWVVPGGEPVSPGGLPEDADLVPRRRPWLVALAVLGAMALLAGMVAFVTGDDDAGEAVGDVSSPDTEPADPDPSSPSSSAPSTTAAEPVPEEEFLAVIDELEAYVAEARGLDWIEEVDVQLVDRATYEERLLRDFEEEVETITEAEVFYRALALLPDPRPLSEQVEDLFTVATGGVYFTDENELYVLGTSLTPYVQLVIVHELVHALDDQHFELYRPEYDDRDDEIAIGLSAIVEGNATRIEERWRSEQPAEIRSAIQAEEEAVIGAVDYSAFAPILLFELQASYSLGSVFARELATIGGERQIDAALADPPETSEQFVFPDLYLDGEPRVDVPAPPAEGEVVDEGVVGVQFLFGLLSQTDGAINRNDAGRAVRGWGGDWFVTWSQGDDVSCMRADFVGDDEEETGELERALETWVDNRDIGDVSTTDDGRVRLESCATTAGVENPQV